MTKWGDNMNERNLRGWLIRAIKFKLEKEGNIVSYEDAEGILDDYCELTKKG